MEGILVIVLIAGAVWLSKLHEKDQRRFAALEDEIANLREMLRERAATPSQSPYEVSTVSTDMGEAETEPEAPLRSVSVPVPSVRYVRRDEPVQLKPLPEPSRPADPPREDAPPPARFRFDFEDIFGRRLPIWAGGVTLAVAGVLLVRYSIEAGLLTERVRVALAFGFGLTLLAVAEIAYRQQARVRDPRVCQALAGAGLATLYAGFYLAGTQYGLMGQSVAFLGLAAVTGAAIALSFRFGLPAAILGLVGGFAAPALVGSEQANLPLLALYLALVTAGLSWTGRRQKRAWLGLAALIGGIGWGGLMLLSEDFGTADLIALGLYFAVVGTVIPALTEYGGMARLVRLGGAALASLQLAVLVAKSLHDPLAWGLYLLLGAALAVFGWRRADLREASAIAAAIGVALLAIWDLPDPRMFAIAAAGLALVFAAVPLAHMRRGEAAPIDHVAAAALPLAIALAAFGQFGDWRADPVQPLLALGTAALGLLPLGSAWLNRAHRTGGGMVPPTAAAGLLFYAALLLVTPGWAAPLAALPIAAALLALLRWRTDGQETLPPAWAALPWGVLGVAALALIATAGFTPELARLAGTSGDTDAWRSVLRWAALAAIAAAATSPATGATRGERHAFAAIAAAFAYGTVAQVIPALWLAPGAAALALAARFGLPRHPAAGVMLAGIAALWAVAPVAAWLEAVVASTGGYPVLVDALPGTTTVLLRILAPAAALAIVIQALASHVCVRANDAALPVRTVVWAGAGALGLVALHVLYKQVFGIGTITRFEALGMAERTVWQALLVGAAWVLAMRAETRLPRLAALALAAAGLAHYALYSALLHNPLWSVQAVGPVPVANLLLAAGAVAVAAALVLRRLLPARIAPACDTAIMAVASVTAIALLRQAFAGSILTSVPLGATEDLLRSVAGIALALVFLAIGARRGKRSWRIGSLAAMLAAVVKVFVFDAAGLEGLVRIASFLALGVSLIAIGWFYARVLTGNAATRNLADPAAR